MRSRTDWLSDLLTLSCSPSEAAEALSSFAWDSDGLAQLGREHLRNAVRAFVERRYSAAELQRWADVIESRDDIRFEPADAALLKEVVFELASPEFEGALTDQRAAQLLLTME